MSSLFLEHNYTAHFSFHEAFPGLKGKDVENVMTAVFEEATSTTHNKVTDAILMWTEVGEGDLETMLGREPWMMRCVWGRVLPGSLRELNIAI